MLNKEKILATATIAHLLEYIDSDEELDLLAAMSTLKQSGLTEFAKENAIMIPLRRDNYPQHERFTGIA